VDVSWGWLYYQLITKSPGGSVSHVASTAAATVGVTFDTNAMLVLSSSCRPEHTFESSLGGRSCWYHPPTFYHSPCAGWTAGPIIATVIALVTIVALVVFCIAFLCNWKTCMSWANHEEEATRDDGRVTGMDMLDSGRIHSFGGAAENVWAQARKGSDGSGDGADRPRRASAAPASGDARGIPGGVPSKPILV